MDFAAEFRRILDYLDESGIDVAVVGGWALAIHGVVRATVDIDLLVRAEQSDEACNVTRSLGFSIQNPSMTLHDGTIVVRRVVRPEPDWNDGVLVLDFLVVTPEIESVWNGRDVVESAFGRVPVVSLEGLAALKRISGRAQDLEDLRALARLALPVLDTAGEDDEANADRVLRPVDRGYSL